MNQYEHALLAMKRLLDVVGESHFAQWIVQDIRNWRTTGDTLHHLSAYGGMGSLNDLVLCRANGHGLTEVQEPWLNALLDSLKFLCHFLASHPAETFTAPQLARHLGGSASSPQDLAGGDPASAGPLSDNRILQGWRCLPCGQSEVSSTDCELLIAQAVIPPMLFASCEQLELDCLVDRILRSEIPGLDARRDILISALGSSGIALRDREGWRRCCPRCGRENAAVYRWRLILENGWRLVPSDDNLPMQHQRKAGAGDDG